jgi:hypothetical protein
MTNEDIIDLVNLAAAGKWLPLVAASLQLRVALRKPTKLNAHATMTATQLAQNGITTRHSR